MQGATDGVRTSKTGARGGPARASLSAAECLGRRPSDLRCIVEQKSRDDGGVMVTYPGKTTGSGSFVVRNAKVARRLRNSPGDGQTSRQRSKQTISRTLTARSLLRGVRTPRRASEGQGPRMSWQFPRSNRTKRQIAPNTPEAGQLRSRHTASL